MILSESEKNRIKGLYGLVTEQEINLERDCRFFNIIDESEFENKKNLINKLINGMKNDSYHSKVQSTQFRLWGMAIVDHTQDLLGSIFEKDLQDKYKKEQYEDIIKHYKEMKYYYKNYLNYRVFSCVDRLIKKLYNITL